MLPEERQERILALLASFQHLSTERIAADLGVSRETVRRDVLKLESLGRLRRVFGGVSVVDDAPEDPIEKRAQVQRKEKQRIARAAVRLLEPGKTVFIDAGSTVSALAAELASLKGLTVVTNSFDVAAWLTGRQEAGGTNGHDVIVLGGRPHNDLRATYGDITVGQIVRYRADFAFLSPVGLHSVAGATSYDGAEAEVARAMCRQSRHVVILADYSKLGRSSRVQFCEIGRIGTIITDGRAREQADFPGLGQSGCNIIVA